MTMSKEDEFVHNLCDQHMEGADIPTLKAQNTALKTALSKAEDRATKAEEHVTKVDERNLQLEKRVKELEAAALRNKP